MLPRAISRYDASSNVSLKCVSPLEARRRLGGGLADWCLGLELGGRAASGSHALGDTGERGTSGLAASAGSESRADLPTMESMEKPSLFLISLLKRLVLRAGWLCW